MAAYVPVRPDTDKFEPDLRRKLARVNGARAGVSLGTNVGKGMRVGLFQSVRGMSGPLAAAFAAVGGIKVFGTFIADARESQRIARLTAAAVESTGGAAKITAREVGDLATAISNKTGADDEAVQSASNLLLAFTKVRNEVGAGNDIFNRATAAATDMGAALGKDPRQAAQQLGKALNDPIRGLSALSRSGVQFTKQQKEQIATLVESGDTLGAQRIILDEVGKKFGGAAKAAADPMDRLRVIVGNAGEKLGGYLLPYIDQAATWLGENLPAALETSTRWFKANLLPILRATGKFLTGTLIPAVSATVGWFKDNREVVAILTGAMAALFVITKAHAAVLAVQAAGGLVKYIKATKLITSVTKVWTAVQWLMNAALAANPIGLVVLAIAALAAGIVYAWKKSETFRRVVITAFKLAGGFVLTMVDKMLGGLQALLSFAGKLPGPLGAPFRKASDAIGKSRDKVRDLKRDLDRLPTTKDVGVRVNPTSLGTVKLVSGPFKGKALALLADSRAGYGGGGFKVPGGWGGAAPRKRVSGFASGGGSLRLAEGGRRVSANRAATVATDVVGRESARTVGRYAVEAVREAVRAAQQRGTGAAGMGRFTFPLPRGRYRVGMPLWGYPGHTGQDFPASVGTPVYAPFAGRFNPRDLGNRSYGRFIDLTSGEWRFIGAHLSRFARGAGMVRAGDLLGEVGSTGNSTGPHLHAEFRRGGKVVDPESVLSFDRGHGWLPPGRHVVQNATGGPEPLVDPRLLGGGLPRVIRLRIGDREFDAYVDELVGKAQAGRARYAGRVNRGG